MKKIADELQNLKKELAESTAIIGKDRVIKGLQAGEIKKVYLASNCPIETRETVEKYSKLNAVDLVTVSLDNEELGVFCKKNFFVSVLGIA